MTNLFKFFATFLFCATFTMYVGAQESKSDKLTRKQNEKKEKMLAKQLKQEEKLKNKYKPATKEDVIYFFGVGSNFNDSTIYLTNIVEMDSLKLLPTTAFMPYRAEFSLQLREYIEGTLGKVNETTCIFYGTKKKKVSKYYYKVKKRYLDEDYDEIIIIDPEKFTFKRPNYSPIQ